MSNKIPQLNEQKCRLIGVGVFFALFVGASMMFMSTLRIEWFFKSFYLLVVTIIFANRKESESADVISGKSIVIYAHCLLPLFVTKGDVQLISATSCGLVALTGLVISVFALTDLWDAFGIVPANRGIVKRGFYRWVRHPIYLGYCVTGLAVLLFSFSMPQLLIFTLLVAGFIYRINAEEALLVKDPSYCDYQTNVRYRLLTYLY